MQPRPFLGVARTLRDPWCAASLAGLCLLLGLIAAFGQDAGVTWDEGFQLQYGERVLAWFRSGFRDRGALEYLDLYLYGGLFDAPAQWIVEHSPLGPFETRHILSALTALLGIAGTWFIAAAVGGSRAGFFAAATLALTPAWIGHGLFNPKDVPFATGAVFATWTAQRIALGPWPLRVRDVVWAGLALGAALGVRPGGAFLASYLLAAVLARGAWAYLQERRETGRAPSVVSMAARNLPVLMCALPITWIVMISAWPWAQIAPFSRPIEAITGASRFNWPGETLFEGKWVAASELPARYLFVWFGITLPELYAVAALAALAWWILTRRREPRPNARPGPFTHPPRALGLALIAISVVLPLAAALATHPTLYDAHRHFLFLFPPLAALAGLALAALTSDVRIRTSIRRGFLAAWITAALLVAVEIVSLHPYEYTYFNRSVGGLPGAVGRFETDYWGASYREGFAWVVKHVRQARVLRIAACDSSSAGRLYYYAQRWPEAAGRFSFVDSPREADLFLAVTRGDCHRDVPAETLHVVAREGAPLLYVLHPTP